MPADRIFLVGAVVGDLQHDVAELGGVERRLQRQEKLGIGLAGHLHDPGGGRRRGAGLAGGADGRPGIGIVFRIDGHAEQELRVDDVAAGRLTAGCGGFRLFDPVNEFIEQIDDHQFRDRRHH